MSLEELLQEARRFEEELGLDPEELLRRHRDTACSRIERVAERMWSRIKERVRNPAVRALLAKHLLEAVEELKRQLGCEG